MTEPPDQPGEAIRAAAASARNRVRGRVDDKLGDLWWALVLRAVILAALGCFAIFWPDSGLTFLVRAVALFLIADGVVGLFGAIAVRDRGANLAQGVVGLVVGALLLAWPDASARTLTILLGAWALFHGLSVLWESRRLDPADPYRSTSRTVSIVLSAVGAAFLFWPNAGTVALAWVIGAGALIVAAVFFYLAQRLKQARDRIQPV